MAGDDIASPALNNSKLILKSKESCLHKKDLDGDFQLLSFVNREGYVSENGKKSNRFRLGKQQLCTCIPPFCTFLCRYCTTMT